MRALNAVRLILCVFYAASLVFVSLKIVEVGGKVDASSPKVDVQAAKALGLIAGDLRKCEGLSNDILAKRYCLRDDVTITGEVLR